MTIRLWGFGVYVGREQGIYLNRFEFHPRTAMLADAWVPEQLSPGGRSYDASLLIAFLHWVWVYERWVDATLGHSYRRSILLQFGKLPGSLNLAAEWLRLQRAISPLHQG